MLRLWSSVHHLWVLCCGLVPPCSSLLAALVAQERCATSPCVLCTSRTTPPCIHSDTVPGSGCCLLVMLSPMTHLALRPHLTRGLSCTVAHMPPVPSWPAGGAPFCLPLPLSSAPITQGDEFAVLHGLCWVAGLLSGASPLHVAPDGTPLPERPSGTAVRDAVVRAACVEGLVTRHTAAVGVMVRRDPLDPGAVTRVEVPLAVPHGAVHFQERDQEEVAQGMNFGANSCMVRHG